MNREKSLASLLGFGLILSQSAWIYLFITLTNSDVGRVMRIVFANPDWLFGVGLTAGLLVVLHKLAPRDFSIRELVIVGVVSISTVISTLGAFTYEVSDIADVEQYTSLISYAKWEEEHEDSYEECVSEDDEGNCTQYRTRCSWVPDRYYAVTTTNEQIPLSRAEFIAIGYRFRTAIEKEWHDYFNDHCDDGYWFYYRWNGSQQTALPVSIDHDYVNLMKGSNTLWETVSGRERYDAFVPEPPRVTGSSRALHYGGISYGPIYEDHVINQEQVLPDSLESWLDFETAYWNGAYATAIERQEVPPREKHVNVIYVFTRQTQEFYYAIHHAWHGGAKNALVILIGVELDGFAPTWVQPMSWTPHERLTIELRDEIMALPDVRDVQTLHQRVATQITQAKDAGWKRLEMANMEYLMADIHVPFWVNLATPAVCILLLSLVIVFFLTIDL